MTEIRASSARSRGKAGHQTLSSGAPAHQRDRETVEPLYERAKNLHRRGQLAAASQLYAEVISLQPDHADALHLLGFAAFQASNFGQAVGCIRKAVELCPNQGEFHNNLALALLCSGDLEGATDQVGEARRVGFRESESLLQVGLELLWSKNLAAAEASFKLALWQAPDSPEAFNYLGIVHKAAGRFRDAIDCYESALRLRPDYCEALNNLGNAWRDSKNLDRSIPYYQAAIAATPSFAAAHNNLGNALRDTGRYAEAEACFARALQIAPNSPEVHNNLGITKRNQRQTEEAVRCFERSLASKPDAVKVIANLAAALIDTGLYQEGADQYRRAAELAPSMPLAHLRAEAACPLIFPDAASMERRWSELNKLLGRFQGSQLPADLAELIYTAGAPPFNVQFFPHDLRGFKEAYAGVFASLPQLWSPPTSAPRRNKRRPGPYRVGVVVTCQHEGVFLKSLGGVLKRIDPERFKLRLFCSSAGVARLRSELQTADIQFQPLPNQLDLAADAIYDSQLDLLYYWEVGTDPINYFLPFLRLAPAQCTSWGIQVTSGIPNVDGYLSSRLTEPQDGDEHYTERLLRASTLLCFRDRARLTVGHKQRHHFGFEDRHIVYVCAQQLGKLHPDFDGILAEILRREPRSLLALTADEHGHGQRALQARFERTLADVAHQVVILPRQEYADYLALLQAGDVLLDPPYFGGVNTTYDGLSLYKPIVTCPSPYHRGRYTFGCFQKMGITSCVVETMADYVELACRLGAEQDFRRAIGSEIRDRSDLLFEDLQAVKEHERLFTELVERAAEDLVGHA